MSDNVPVPTVELLIKELKDVIDDWKPLGGSLGVPVRKLDAIMLNDPNGGVENWKLKMFQFWLQYKPDTSWKDVVRALKENDYNNLAATLSRKYLLAADSSEAQVSTDEIEAEIRATATIVQRLQDLEISFAEMLTDLPDLLTECKCNLSNALRFLGLLFNTKKFSQCDTIEALLWQLRQDHIDAFNTYYLQKLITHFSKKMEEEEKKKLMKPIEDYEMERERFLNDTLVIEFHRAVVCEINPAELNQKTKLTIKVSDRLADKETLKDIEQLALNAFEECHRSLVRMHATIGSVVISWFIPEDQSDEFETLAEKNAAVFKDAGVEEVTVGGRVVFPCTLVEYIPTASLKEIYTDLYHRLVEAVSDEHTCQSLLTQLSSPALISEEKIAQLTSSKVTGIPFLKTLGLEEEPHLLVPLVSAMSGIEYQAGEVSTVKQAITRDQYDQYKQFLKMCYRQPLPDDDKLLSTASKHYIELSVISKEGITKKQADKFTKKSFHGLTEQILREKAPIALKHILKPREDGTPVRLVLVEGAPGIGKSTLAWEVCHKWEELESVKQYELVVLVRLREKKAQEARCLGDLLPCDATTNMNELLAAIGDGKGMLIVCDGFDELPHNQRQVGSVYIDLLKGRLLPEAIIIVTSRPSVSADLWRHCQHNIHRHLEVIGFTKEDIKQFAESVFSGDILAGFLSYITSNPPIYGMMYIPLNAVIVALIYQDSYDTDTPFPTTMTQLFDALTRAHIRRHLVSTHQVPSEYCMPPSLQRTEDISKLPLLVAQQLLQLARVAYMSLYQKCYVFTDLGEDFEHLGMMKKVSSINLVSGPECSYTFLHLGLQEYLTALHIAIVNPNGFKLVEWLNEGSVVVRLLAGICRHDDYHSHPVYQELVQQLGSDSPATGIQLVHCAYECPSIMDSVKMDYSECDTINVAPVVGFDWYATGYCISHFDGRWGLRIMSKGDMGIDLLVKGLRSSAFAKRRIHFLFLQSLSFSQTILPLRKFCELHILALHDVSIDHDDVVILQQLIAPGSGLRRLEYCHYSQTHTNTFISILFQPSSLQELALTLGGDNKLKSELLPHVNTNLKKLIISRSLLHPLAVFIPNITSLTYLKFTDLGDSDLPVLVNIVQSHHTLEVLHIGFIRDHDSSANTNLLQLIEAAGNSNLKKLKLEKAIHDKLPLHIQEQYKYLL